MVPFLMLDKWKTVGNPKPAMHTFDKHKICYWQKYTHFTGFGCPVQWNPNWYTYSTCNHILSIRHSIECIQNYVLYTQLFFSVLPYLTGTLLYIAAIRCKARCNIKSSIYSHFGGMFYILRTSCTISSLFCVIQFKFWHE